MNFVKIFYFTFQNQKNTKISCQPYSQKLFKKKKKNLLRKLTKILKKL